MNKSKIPESVKTKIIDELIIPTFIKDIRYTINTRSLWSLLATICTVGTTLAITLTTILAFLKLSFYAGICGILSVSLKEFGSFANYQDHLKTIEVNDILNNLGIDLQLSDETKIRDDSFGMTNPMNDTHPLNPLQINPLQVNPTQGNPLNNPVHNLQQNSLDVV